MKTVQSQFFITYVAACGKFLSEQKYFWAISPFLPDQVDVYTMMNVLLYTWLLYYKVRYKLTALLEYIDQIFKRAYVPPACISFPERWKQFYATINDCTVLLLY